MIPKDCKRLAEVDFPIAEVSRHAAREKSIRHGHPSTLHMWWARRPLASSRAVLLALLWPDPCDPLCPAEFKAKARAMLPQVLGKVGPADGDLRDALKKFIADFANWDNAAQSAYLEVSRTLVTAAHGKEPPLVVDPFAGGGSIPLEALRLGCEVFASDLNPVACLILKVMLKDIPRDGPALADGLRRAGAEINRQAEKSLVDFYPKDPDGATPIAYLWARTVRCESPNCGAEIPLMRSFWLCKKAKRKQALKCEVVRPKGEPPRVEFEVFEPKAEKDVRGGTVSLAKATCLACGSVLTPTRAKAQLAAVHGGADVLFDGKGSRIGGARLLAVVTLRPGEPGRHYRLPTERDYQGVCEAEAHLAAMIDQWDRGGRQGLCPVPDEATPRDGTGGVGGGYRTRKYGIRHFGDFFTSRQKLALVTMRHLSGPRGDALGELLAIAVSRCVSFWSSLNMWVAQGEFVANVFGRQALPIVWDFCEVVPTSTQSGGFDGAVDWVARVAEAWPGSMAGQVQPADATEHPLPDETACVWFTDPPYYDSVPYADLSDFFFVWLKRSLPALASLGTSDGRNELTPKVREAVRDEQDHLDRRPKKPTEWYEQTMHLAFAEGRRVLQPNGIGSVVFAHKTTEGWGALLSGMIHAGWTITGSWPIATERPGRLRSQESAALATSVHLICRPRPDDVPVGDWADVLRELPHRVGDWMERLQTDGVRGADLVFACIGPALEIFSRYAKVETAEGREVELAEYLEKVWEVVGRSALAQVLGTAEAKARNGAAGAIEEDARLTALFLWTLQSTDSEPADGGNGEGEVDGPPSDNDEEGDSSRGKASGFTLIFDVVRRFAQPLGIELPKWEGRVIETKKGVVRLLPIAERSKQLFGEDGAQAVAARLEQAAAVGSNPLQGMLFPDLEAVPKDRERGRGSGKLAGIDVSDESLAAAREATTLDRVHAAMLLQAGGRTNALRALLRAEQERSPDFLRLANAFSALYPKGSEEKRLIDAMLLAVPR
jgi:adenine-specific DNA methylase